MTKKNNPCVGAVVLNYRSYAYLEGCLSSLARAENSAPLQVLVVDNASGGGEAEKCAKLCASLNEGGGSVFFEFTALPKNLGFAGGNNIGIKKLLENENVTHIALINADAVLCGGWLDLLLACGAPLAGPVSNAGGGVQTVFGSPLEMRGEYLAEIEKRAAARQKMYNGFCQDARMLTFFTVLIRREVFEEIGFLDERFFPGMFEDDDYCMRAQQAGFKMAVARDCYVHHWGGQSFKADKTASASFEENLARFTEKWGAEHTHREPEIYDSVIMDCEWLLQKGLMEENTAGEVTAALKFAKNDRENLLLNYKAMRAAAQGAGGEVALKDMPKQILHKVKRKLGGEKGE